MQVPRLAYYEGINFLFQRHLSTSPNIKTGQNEAVQLCINEAFHSTGFLQTNTSSCFPNNTAKSMRVRLHLM